MSALSDITTFARTGTATFVDSDGVLQTAATGVPRTAHHLWDGSAWVNAGLLLESEARTQLLHTTNALVTQSTTVTAVPHTLHFTGTGAITLSGASTAGPLVGTGIGENNRVSLTFTPSAASLTLTVTGTVTNAQLEVGDTPSSYIPNTAGSGTATRNAETLTIAAADAPWPEPVVIGPELVTNGTFNTDLTGWTDAGSAWAVVGGEAYFAPNDQFDTLFQNLGLVAGKVYKITFDYNLVQGQFRAQGRNASGGAVTDPGLVYTQATLGTGSEEIVFTAASTEVGIIFARNATGVTTEFYIDNVSVQEINPLSVSIQMEGTVIYADDNTFGVNFRWLLDGGNFIQYLLDRRGGLTGRPTFEQREGFNATKIVNGPNYTPGINVPFNIASRHGTTFINGAVDGTVLTADLTPTALPDLSATDVQIGPDFMGTIKLFRIWAEDIGDAGIASAST